MAHRAKRIHRGTGRALAPIRNGQRRCRRLASISGPRDRRRGQFCVIPFALCDDRHSTPRPVHRFALAFRKIASHFKGSPRSDKLSEYLRSPQPVLSRRSALRRPSPRPASRPAERFLFERSATRSATLANLILIVDPVATLIAPSKLRVPLLPPICALPPSRPQPLVYTESHSFRRLDRPTRVTTWSVLRRSRPRMRRHRYRLALSIPPK